MDSSAIEKLDGRRKRPPLWGTNQVAEQRQKFSPFRSSATRGPCGASSMWIKARVATSDRHWRETIAPRLLVIGTSSHPTADRTRYR